MREAIVIVKATGLPALDFDPVDLPMVDAGDVAPPDSDAVMNLWCAVLDAEVNTPLHLVLGLSVVWSDDQTPVRFLCPDCDDVCDVDSGAINDAGDSLVCPDCL